MKGDLRHILFISYLYPPVVNPGSYHVIRYARYLPAHGFHPIILTSSTRGTLPNDEANGVFRAGETFASLKRLYRARQLRGVGVERQASTSVVAQTGLGAWLKQLAIPDLQVTWYPSALRRARVLAARFPLKAIYSSSGPETNHLVALSLKRETGLPWVADFRDGWLFEPLISARQTGRLRRLIESRLERAVVMSADQISVLNQRMADDFCRRYPQAAKKITVSSNGYDANDFASIERTSSSKLTLVHTGSLALSRGGTVLQGFLDALTRLKAEQHPLMRDLEVLLVGRLTEAETAAIARAGLDDVTRLVGEVLPDEARRYQVSADVLLLITHPNQLAISTTKLFEYLGARRPILALTPPESSAAAIVREVNAGTIVPPDDAKAIRAALIDLHDRWHAGPLAVADDPGVLRYEYRHLTAQLAGLFDRAIGDCL